MDEETELRPVAWRVKDMADGWILFHDEKSARLYIEQTTHMDTLIQPLYTRAHDPVAEELAAALELAVNKMIEAGWCIDGRILSALEKAKQHS